MNRASNHGDHWPQLATATSYQGNVTEGMTSTPRPNHQPPVNASRLLEHWQPSKEMNQACNHGHDIESHQLPRERYRGNDLDTERASKGMNQRNDIEAHGQHWPPVAPCSLHPPSL